MSYRTTRAFERQHPALPFTVEWKNQNESEDAWAPLATVDGLLLAVWLMMQMGKANPAYDYRVK